MSIDRIQRDIEALAAFSEPCDSGITRPSYTASYRKAADYLIGVMGDAGLKVREDAAGNIFGLRESANPGAVKVISGSHLDTVRNGGAFDGVAGIVCALEAVRLLNDRNKQLDYTYEVAAFAGEEGTRFGQVLMGSKIITGSIKQNQLDLIKDATGISLKQALLSYHGRCDIEAACQKKDAVEAFLEIHIEQGPILEQSNYEIGIVSRIQGVCWIKVTIEGVAGHAGAFPMKNRKDAGIAAYKLITDITHFVTENFPENATLTVGSLELFPGSSNVIPGKCVFTLDIRGTTSKVIDTILVFFNEQVDFIQVHSGLVITGEILNRNEPVFLDETVIENLQRAVKKSGYTYTMMNSGAGHDAMELASIWKTGMLFVPSIGGITHRPDEFTPFAALEKGAVVLLHMLLDFRPVCSQGT